MTGIYKTNKHGVNCMCDTCEHIRYVFGTTLTFSEMAKISNSDIGMLDIIDKLILHSREVTIEDLDKAFQQHQARMKEQGDDEECDFNCFKLVLAEYMQSIDKADIAANEGKKDE